MKVKITYSTWTGTYMLHKPGKPPILMKTPTPAMREVMNNSKPRTYRQYKIWEVR